jgi:hypothetical protein
VEVRVFNRHGVDKDERALQIEREEVERLSRDRDDELAILERNIYTRLKDLILGKTAVKGRCRVEEPPDYRNGDGGTTRCWLTETQAAVQVREAAHG